MVQKATESIKENKTPPSTTPADSPPDDFKKLSFDLVGFFQPDFNEVIYGKIAAFRKRKKEDVKDPDRFYYIIELIQELNVVNFEKQKSLAPKGSHVWLDERAAYMTLRDYVVNEGYCWIKPLKKVPMKGGKSTWRMDVRVKGKAGPPPTASMDMVARPIIDSDKEEADDNSPPF